MFNDSQQSDRFIQSMTSREQITSSEPTAKLPETYLGLISKVGDIGKYQYWVAAVIFLAWYSTGIILMSTAFLFLNPSFDCQAFGLVTGSCYDYVCALPKEQWATFITPQANSFKSLANAFEPYYCDDELYLNLYSSSTYLGALLGYIFVSFFADNYGRKKTSIYAWGICCVGCIILMLSKAMWMASIGLFMCGFGSDSVLSITASIIAQQFNDISRQKYYSILQGSFTFGALFVTLVYYLWEDWFITVAIFLFVPSLLTLLGIIFIVKESPLYLIRESPQKALKELNLIGKMNKGCPDILSMQDIQNVMLVQLSEEYQQICTPLDVFKYGSLRVRTITQAVVSISTYILYYGPTLIVTQFGFDIYTSSTILNVADLLTYYPLMLIVDKIPRRRACMIQFGTATFIAAILIFLTKPEGCENCPIIFIQLGLIFIFRFMISMEFTLMNVYQSELYPIRIRNIANGVLGVFGTISSTTAPLVMGVLTRANINHFILFTMMGIIATGAYSFSPQTLGKLCPEQIEEIEYLKAKKSAARITVSGEKIHKH